MKSLPYICLSLLLLLTACGQEPPARKASKSLPTEQASCPGDGLITHLNESCLDDPGEWTVFGSECWLWRGTEYFVISLAMEAEVYRRNGLAETSRVSYTRMRVPPQGDQDAALTRISLGDSYGAAWFFQELVTFEIHPNSSTGKPYFSNYTYHGVPTILGGAVLAYGEDDYLLAHGLTPTCTHTSVLKLHGVNAFEFRQCLAVDVVAAVRDGNYLYVTTDSQQAFRYRIEPATDLYLTQRQYLGYAYGIFDRAFDAKQGTYVQTNTSGTSIRKLTTSGTLVEVAHLPYRGNRARLSHDARLLLLGKKGALGGELLYSLANASKPQLLHTFAKDASSPCGKTQAVDFFGGRAELLRYRIWRTYDVSGCLPAISIFMDGFETGNTDAWGGVS